LCTRHLPELWGSEGSRKGVEAGQQKEQEEGENKEGRERERKRKKEGEKEGSEVARRGEHEGDVIFRDFFTPFFAGRCVEICLIRKISSHLTSVVDPDLVGSGFYR
jgi:hypothetical protein